MRHYLLLLLVATTLVSLVNGQELKNAIYIEPKAVLAKGLEIGYERVISPRLHAAVNIAYYRNGNSKWVYPASELHESYRVQADLKHFFKQKQEQIIRPYVSVELLFKSSRLDPLGDSTQIRGTWVDVFAQAASMSFPSYPSLPYRTVQRASAIGWGLTLGAQYAKLDPFYLDTSVGFLSYHTLVDPRELEHVHKDFINPFDGIQPSFNLSLGVRF